MKRSRRQWPIILAIGAALCAGGTSLAQQELSDDEIALEQTEGNVLQIRRQLFQARQRNDQEAIEKLEKSFKKAQDERVRLLRKSQRM